MQLTIITLGGRPGFVLVLADACQLGTACALHRAPLAGRSAFFLVLAGVLANLARRGRVYD